MDDRQIKYMVDRFLRWRLPESFSPDAGISFKRTFNDHLPTPTRHEPFGTNLFTAEQTEAMVRYMIGGMPSSDRRHLDTISDEPLPCDVHLPPNTLITKGCTLSTLLTAFNIRGGRFQLGPMREPLPMILTCPYPRCGRRHIDQGEFATKPHHTHACQYCGMVWRPGLVNTVGVRFLPGFKNQEEEK